LVTVSNACPDGLSIINNWDPQTGALELNGISSSTLNVLNDNGCITIDQYGAMLAQNTPQALNNTTPSWSSSRLCDMSSRVITEVYDDDNAYDSLTGIWTCPATGRYNLNFYVHLTIDDQPNGWYDPAVTGMIGVGIMTPTGCNFYCGEYITISRIMKHIDISGASLGMPIAAGTQLCLKIVNLTSIDYAPVNGDVQRLVIQRIR
jgi:hypothetical protein